MSGIYLKITPTDNGWEVKTNLRTDKYLTKAAVNNRVDEWLRAAV